MTNTSACATKAPAATCSGCGQPAPCFGLRFNPNAKKPEPTGCQTADYQGFSTPLATPND